MIFSNTKKLALPTPEQALKGRQTAMVITNQHFVTGHPIAPPLPDYLEQAVFALGCFWGGLNVSFGNCLRCLVRLWVIAAVIR